MLPIGRVMALGFQGFPAFPGVRQGGAIITIKNIKNMTESIEIIQKSPIHLEKNMGRILVRLQVGSQQNWLGFRGAVFAAAMGQKRLGIERPKGRIQGLNAFVRPGDNQRPHAIFQHLFQELWQRGLQGCSLEVIKGDRRHEGLRV